jgi:beta-lactam-binding protein with PASTA domain
MQPRNPEPEVDLRNRCGLHVRVTADADAGGSELVTMPTVMRMRLSRAIRLLESIGFGWDVQPTGAETRAVGGGDIVCAQNPSAGWPVPVETVVHIHVR